MNRILVAVILLLTASGLQAQSRKHISNFSAYQSYYNPSLTGHEGSMLRSLYRNQWTGFEDAPTTLLFAAELDADDLKRGKDRTGHYQYRNSGSGYQGARHAFGLVAMQDRFGPTRESQLALNYGTGARLSERISLRWGAALTFNNFRLDGNSLVVDNESDPRYQHVLGQYNGISKLDLNLGFALTAGSYFLGYALQDITRGRLLTSGDDYIRDVYTRKHLLQAGVRTNLGDEFGLIVNGLYQYDKQLKSALEGQVKVVYHELLWAGAGYRNDLAFHVAAGLHYKQLRISYAYESPVQDARSVNRASNEIGLAYTLKPADTNRSGRARINFW